MNSPIVLAFDVSTRACAAAILTWCAAAATSVVRAEPLPATEARALLRQSQREEPRRPGSYRETVDRPTKVGRMAQTTLVLITPDHRRFMRAERDVTVTGKPDENRHIVTITTPEGRWFVYREAAILEPIANLEPLLATARQIVDTPAASDPALDQLRHDHPYLADALAVERHGRYTRETVDQDGHRVCVITETYDDEGRRALDALSDRLFQEAKAQFGPVKRLLIAAYVGFVNVPKKLPAKYAFEIDVTNGRLLTTTITTVGGDTRVQHPPNSHYVATSPLSEAEFALPANVTVFRPKTQAEFIQLQLRYEEKPSKPPRPTP